MRIFEEETEEWEVVVRRGHVECRAAVMGVLVINRRAILEGELAILHFVVPGCGCGLAD